MFEILHIDALLAAIGGTRADMANAMVLAIPLCLFAAVEAFRAR
jgi:hypothetical protein